MIIKHIDEQTFDEFSSKSKYTSFTQTSDFAARRTLRGWDYKLLGFFKDDKLVGAMTLNSKRVFLNKKRYESMFGPLFDFDDLELTKQGLTVLKDYLDKNNAVECFINPNLAINEHYPKLKKIRDSEKIVSAFKTSGWEFLENSDLDPGMLRWFFKKDLSKFSTYKEVTDSYEAETKRLVKNSQDFPLKIVELNQDNLHRVSDILDQTGERQNFSTWDFDNHKSFFNYMNKNFEAKYLVVELDVNKYLDVLNDEINTINKDIAADIDNTSKRAVNRVKQNKDQLKARQNRVDQLKEIKQDTIDICSGVFVGTNDTMTYLLGGSKKEFTRYYGTYFLQNYTIKYAYEQGYKLYDFYGTRSRISGFPKEEGIFTFKKGFGGKLFENIGYFRYQPNNMINKVYESLRSLKHKIKN